MGDILNLMRLIQFSDSAFPVGTFSFSNGLESASFEKLVKNADTLKQYVKAASLQAAFTDSIAAIKAFRYIKENNYEGVKTCDEYIILYKNNSEARLMQTRMGKKLAELSASLIKEPVLNQWLDDINSGVVKGTYPISQALTFAYMGMSEKDLFSSHQYGIVNMILSAALRCVRVSHIDTQKILFEMSRSFDELYNEVKELNLQDMNSFAPEIDLMASIHENGMMRMFMN